MGLTICFDEHDNYDTRCNLNGQRCDITNRNVSVCGTNYNRKTKGKIVCCNKDNCHFYYTNDPNLLNQPRVYNMGYYEPVYRDVEVVVPSAPLLSDLEDN